MQGTLSEAYSEAMPHVLAHLAKLSKGEPQAIHIETFTIHTVTKQDREDPYGVYTTAVPEYTIRRDSR